MAGGAVLGTPESSAVTNSTTAFSVGVALLCFGSWATVMIVRHRSPELANDHHSVPDEIAVVT